MRRPRKKIGKLKKQNYQALEHILLLKRHSHSPYKAALQLNSRLERE